MNTFSQFDPMPDSAETAQPVRDTAMELQKYMLMRVGQRPLAFEGSELCMAMGFSPRVAWWYEINLFRVRPDGFVVAIKKFYQDEQERDLCHAWQFESFAEAIDHLETYDAAGDVRIEIRPDDPDLMLPELAAHALALRAQVAEARGHYKSLVGEILYDLESS